MVKDFDYDSIHPGYYHDAMLKGGSTQKFWHRVKFETVASLIPKKNVTVFDVGCGPGSFFYVLRKQNSKAKLVGTDLIKSQVDYARKIVPKAKFFVSDATKDFPGEKSDYVTLIEVVEHLPNSSERMLFKRIKKKLKVGGSIIVTTPNYISLWPLVEFFWNLISPISYQHQHINKKTIPSLKKSLKLAGFEIKTVKSIYVISPFLSWISPKLARWVFSVEQKILPRFGSVMVIEAVKK